uniref:DinB family protein n=1 Tax=Tessaracoccus timonensis TaxID=2161816 RepID=UPI000D552699|nr:DinB family protein [Tessaracoccus timonensis]
MTEPHIDAVGRPEPRMDAGETETLLGFLDYQRATLEWKTRDLTDEQLRQRLHPTTMTLAGMLAHLATVEDFWFSMVVAEGPFPDCWPSEVAGDPDWEWTVAMRWPGERLRGVWVDAVARSRAVVEKQLAQPDDVALSATHPAWGGRAHVSLRWVLVHMIEEYARHNGHADLLRESIDGETGE